MSRRVNELTAEVLSDPLLESLAAKEEVQCVSGKPGDQHADDYPVLFVVQVNGRMADTHNASNLDTPEGRKRGSKSSANKVCLVCAISKRHRRTASAGLHTAPLGVYLSL